MVHGFGTVSLSVCVCVFMKMFEKTDWIIRGLEDRNFSEILSNMKDFRDMSKGLALLSGWIIIDNCYFHFLNLDILLAILSSFLSMSKIGKMLKK